MCPVTKCPPTLPLWDKERSKFTKSPDFNDPKFVFFNVSSSKSKLTDPSKSSRHVRQHPLTERLAPASIPSTFSKSGFIWSNHESFFSSREVTSPTFSTIPVNIIDKF